MAVRRDVLVLVVIDGRPVRVVQDDVHRHEGLGAEALEGIEDVVVVPLLVLRGVLEGIVADVGKGLHDDADEVVLLVIRAHRRQIDPLGPERHVLRMRAGLDTLQDRPAGREGAVSAGIETDSHAFRLCAAEHRVGLEEAVVAADGGEALALGCVRGAEDREVDEVVVPGSVRALRVGVVRIVGVAVRDHLARAQVRVFRPEGVAVLEFLPQLRGGIRGEGDAEIVEHLPGVHPLAHAVPFHEDGRGFLPVQAVDVVHPDDARLLDDLQGERLQDAAEDLLPVEGHVVLVDEVVRRDGERREGHRCVVRELRGRVALVDGAVVDSGGGEGALQDLAQRLLPREVVGNPAEHAEVVEGQLHVVVGAAVVGLAVCLGVQAAAPVQDVVPVDIQPDGSGNLGVQVRIGAVAGRFDGERRHGSADGLLRSARVPFDGKRLIGREDELADRRECRCGLLKDLAPPDVTGQGQKFPGIS